MRISTYLLMLLLIFNSNPAFSAQKEIHKKCATNEQLKVTCNIRFARPWFAPGAPQKVEVIWPDDVREEISFKTYNPNEDTSAWLLLFDRSKSLDKKSLSLIREDFGRVISSLRSKEKLGIATFAESFRMIAPIGVEHSQLELALKQLEPVGNETYLYQAALQGLEQLGQFNAKRRALVIISDGISEDGPDTTFQSVIKRANELDIVVYSIGYSQKPENDAYLDELNEIAKQTQGPSQRALLYKNENRVLSPRLMQYFLDYMQNGGTASFARRLPEQQITAQLVATLENGRRLTTKIEFNPLYIEKAEVPKIKEPELGLFGIPKNYEVMVLSTIAGLVILLLLWFFFWILKKSSSDENLSTDLTAEDLSEDEITTTDELQTDIEETSAQETIAETPSSTSNNIYGYFEQITPVSSRIELKKTTLTMGRHHDNDIEFSSATVHRRHGTLHMTADKNYALTDLSGPDGNGITVNDQKIETIILKNGDLIELGDIQLRYIETDQTQ